MTSIHDLFLRYDYAETKDLCKYFLTLISGVLALSATFSRNLAGPRPGQIARSSLLAAWVLFALAMVLCGLALVWNTQAAGQAIYGRADSYPMAAHVAYRLVVVAGASFISGLFALTVSAGCALFADGQPHPS